jgi:hypothetical protein
MKNQPKKPPTPRQRLFTNEFKLGDRVSVIREEHGWHEGAVEGRITFMTPTSCTVTSDEGSEYSINHPRDIHKMH